MLSWSVVHEDMLNLAKLTRFDPSDGTSASRRVDWVAKTLKH